MKSFYFIVVMVAAAVSAYAQPTIDATNWPYGSDQVGNYWDYYNTAGNTPVNINTINPYQQGGSWDFSSGPTNSTASSEIISVASSPTPRPPTISFVEHQTAGGSEQWVYEDETAVGTWARGFRQGGTTYNYSSPHWNVYRYPMTYGTIWNNSWVWGEAELGAPMQETRNNEIVGWGTVTVPHGGPLPCLVMRTYSLSYLEFLGIPLVNDTYRLYEWIVPGIGSVVTIQSVVNEPSWYYTTAGGFYRLNDTNLGGDLQPPTITGVPDLNDTPNPGPYNIPATITDDSGVAQALLYYSIQNAAFVSTPPTNVNGDDYTFQIPMMTGVPVKNIRYYVWAKDGSLNENSTTSPPGGPGNFYQFNWINDNLPPSITNVTVWPSPSEFNGPFPVNATITDDNGILFASIHYKIGTMPYDEAVADGNVGDVYSFTIPAITATSIIRYYVEAVDNSGFFNTGTFPAGGMSAPIIFQAVYTVPAPPLAPEELVIYSDGSDVILTWEEVTQDINGNSADVDHYNIFRSTSSGGGWSLYDSSPTNSYTDVGAGASNDAHFYHVTAVE